MMDAYGGRLPDAEVRRLETKAAARRDGLLRASSLAGLPVPARDWHTAGLIPARTVTQFNGDGGTGKSTAALQLSVATVARRPWLGMQPKPGPVLYVSAEDDEDELHRRLVEICVGLEVGLDDLDDLHLWPLADQDAVLAAAGRDGQMEATPRWSELMSFAREVRPVLIVLDSLADIYGGNENVRSEVRGFVAMLRRLAITTSGAVLLLSHPSLAGMSSGSGTSGSTAWSNSVRSRIYLSKPGDGLDSDPDVRVLSLRKSNYGPAQADLRLRRRLGGFFLDGDAGPSDVAGARRRIDDLFLELLASYEAQGRTVSDRPGANYAPLVFARDAAAKGANKGGLTSAMNRLFSARAIAVVTVGRPSRPLRKIISTTSEVPGEA
jgi:RecA-family ATPase